MNNYIYIIILTFILASANLGNDHNKYSEATIVENKDSGDMQENMWNPETKGIQDKNWELNKTDEQVASENEEVNKSTSKETDEYLSYFVGKVFDPSYHPPTAASGSVMEEIVIDKIEAGKASGHISCYVAFLGSRGTFDNAPINDDNSIIVTVKWSGKDPQTDERFPIAYTKTKLIFDRVLDGNPVIKTIELGPIEGCEEILEEYYFNSTPGTISEWFSNNYMYYDLNMTEEEMIDWIAKNINTP